MTMQSSHFGSQGEYYSFGNKTNFGMVNDSSLDQYEIKKYRSAMTTRKSIINATVMEHISAMEIELGMN